MRGSGPCADRRSLKPLPPCCNNKEAPSPGIKPGTGGLYLFLEENMDQQPHGPKPEWGYLGKCVLGFLLLMVILFVIGSLFRA